MSEASNRHDIRNREDIAHLVEAFYGRAFADDVLGHIFIDIARMDLAAHMPIMCDFWETVLFQAGLYQRNAFNVHLDLHRQEALTPMHFQRWLDIWEGTVDDLFQGEKANLAKVQADRIAGSINRRLERTADGELLTVMPRRTSQPLHTFRQRTSSPEAMDHVAPALSTCS